MSCVRLTVQDASVITSCCAWNVRVTCWCTPRFSFYVAFHVAELVAVWDTCGTFPVSQGHIRGKYLLWSLSRENKPSQLPAVHSRMLDCIYWCVFFLHVERMTWIDSSGDGCTRCWWLNYALLQSVLCFRPWCPYQHYACTITHVSVLNGPLQR